jgi:hypothetical protein
VSDTRRIRIRGRYAFDMYPWSIGFLLFLENSDTYFLIRISWRYTYLPQGIRPSPTTAHQTHQYSSVPRRPSLIPTSPRTPHAPQRRDAGSSRARPQLTARRPPTSSLRSPATSIRPGPAVPARLPARHRPPLLAARPSGCPCSPPAVRPCSPARHSLD